MCRRFLAIIQNSIQNSACPSLFLLVGSIERFLRKCTRSGFKIAIRPTLVFLNDSRFKHHFNLIWQIDRFHGSEDPIFEDCMDRF